MRSPISVYASLVPAAKRILGRISGHIPRRIDVPLRGDGSVWFLPAIVAAMAYLCSIAALGLISLGDTLGNWDREEGAVLTVEIPAGTSAGRIESAMTMLRGVPGALVVRPIEPDEAARLLEPWLGPGAPIETLPLPRLIDLRIKPDAAIDFPVLRQRLAAIAPGAQLDDHRLQLDQLRAFASRLEAVVTLMVGGIAAMTVVAVLFATRASLAIHAVAIGALHLLGASDDYVAVQFQWRAFLLGLIGGALGAGIAAATLVGLASAGQAPQWPMQLAAAGASDLRFWALLVLLPPVAGLTSMLTARLTVLRCLARLY
ncbi:MAG: hypothetical protein JO267_10440 [Alphaproteobacteria bacterium]|nr:hypothetical protein [Alphaproteobacteria bacterium]